MRYELSASLATLQHAFKPCRVLVNGKRLRHKRWSYDAATQVLTARFRAKKRALRLDVRRRGCRGGG